MPMAALFTRRAAAVVFLGCLATLLAACSSVTIDAVETPSPPPPARLVVVGEMTTADAATSRLARRFRRDLAEALADALPTATVTARPPVVLGADALVVTGRFAALDAGNEFTRLAIGFGAGGPRLKGTFQLADGAGRPLLRFDQEAQPGTGRGWDAHWDPFDPDSAIDDFAAATAAAIADWLEGEEL